jgi:hypothetical protein
MMRVKIKQQNATRKLRNIKNGLNRVPRKAFDYFVKETPIRSGNAKRRTRFQKSDTINADYPYAESLDNGASKQAPLGMSIPTFAYIRRLVRRAILTGRV